ncbi:MAG: 6,7-dimethyl-8-ribityllumazine synthase [Myxococcota bacterium]|jgi:6,7-dimethyl-8-ribityllumazine synthase|nr:6,7-dimethyl-8-ribityllumazine synthase [Myxococcota bacterium]
MQTYPTNLDATGLSIAVVVARFNHLVSARLLEGCRSTFLELGGRAEDLHVAWVPGAFEIPQAARLLAESGRYNAVVTLGSVIRGGTPHFDYVCDGVTDGVREVMRETAVPVAFGVLTVNDIEQALDRAGGCEGNKGADVTRAAVEMAALLPALAKPPAVDAS